MLSILAVADLGRRLVKHGDSLDVRDRSDRLRIVIKKSSFLEGQ